MIGIHRVLEMVQLVGMSHESEYRHRYRLGNTV